MKLKNRKSYRQKQIKMMKSEILKAFRTVLSDILRRVLAYGEETDKDIVRYAGHGIRGVEARLFMLGQ